MSTRDKVEAFRLYKKAVDLEAPQEMLDRLLSIIQESDSGFEGVSTQQSRQIEGLESVEEDRSNVAQVDALLKKASDLDAPEELTEKLLKLRRKVNDPLEVGEELYAMPAIALEGFTAGILGDEFRAKTRSVLFGGDYDDLLAEERQIESDFFEQHPVLGYSTLIGSSLIPSSFLMKMAGVGKTALGGALRQGSVAGAEGTVYGFMEAEGGFAERAEQAVKIGALSAGLGGTVGGFLGRAEGRSIRESEELAEALERDLQAKRYLQGKLTEEIDGKTYKLVPMADEVIGAFQSKMDEYALKYFNETGKSLEGLDYGKALQAVSDDLGVPVSKLRSAEAVTGKAVINFDTVTEKELRSRLGTLADEVGFVNGRYNPNKFQAWFTKKIGSLQRQSSKYVGPRFASAIQRVGSTMARRGADTENIITAPNTREFFASVQEDDVAKRLLLNMSQISAKDPKGNIEIRKEAYEQLVQHLKQNYGQKAVDGFEAMRARIQAVGLERQKKLDSAIETDPYYWPSEFVKRKDDGFGTTSANKKTSKSSYDQKREQLIEGDLDLPNYRSPSDRAVEWLRESDGVLALMDKLKLRNLNVTRQALVKDIRQAQAAGDAEKVIAAKKKLKRFNSRVRQGDAVFDEIRAAAGLEKANSATADKAQDLARSLVVMGSRGPSGFISTVRKMAYMGTIANPYSAVLNVGDVFNSMVNYGYDNTVDSIVDMMRLRGVDMSVADVGLARQTTGEFIGEGVGKWEQRWSRLSEESFKRSGFTTVDRFGKNVALRAGIKEGQKLARTGKLEEKWGHAFTKNEMSRLKRDLLAGKKTNMTTEFAAAQLARLQPSDMSQLPKWYLDNPNWRVLYMLRTFGLKQMAQIERLVIEEYKAGNKKEAVKNAVAYMGVVGGGNAFINEGRQVLKGDAPSLDNIPMRWADHMLGATTANIIGTYQLQRAAGGESGPLVESVAPAPISMLFAPLIDAAQFGFGSKEWEDYLEKSKVLGWLPFGNLAQDWLKD